MTLVLCDLGGTNCRFAMPDSGDIGPVTAFKNDNHVDFLSAVQAYCAQMKVSRIDGLIVALAAPTQAQEIQLTNSSWVLSNSNLQSALYGAEVAFLNDLQAVALGLDGPGLNVRTLRTGHPSSKCHRLVVNIGTGFNTAALTAEGTVLACEAGHATFPAETEFDHLIQAVFARRFGRCSLDRVLSGSGLMTIYDIACKFLEQETEHKTSEALLIAAIQGSQTAATMACSEFCRLVGRISGDLALTFLATGGVWMTGGLGRALEPLLRAGRTGFFEALEDKGRMTDLAKTFPIHVIQNDVAALQGCLRYAAMQGIQ
ncbi:MAG: glucokinase [Paracoccaceae bacterium]